MALAQVATRAMNRTASFCLVLAATAALGALIAACLCLSAVQALHAAQKPLPNGCVRAYAQAATANGPVLLETIACPSGKTV